ncbi:MAG: DUF1641 domain-containing protein [Pyrobaculum sp.]
MLATMDQAHINAIGAAMQGGVTCVSKSLREIGAPKMGLFAILKALGDPEIQKAIGTLFTILKAMGTCMELKTSQQK